MGGGNLADFCFSLDQCFVQIGMDVTPEQQRVFDDIVRHGVGGRRIVATHRRCEISTGDMARCSLDQWIGCGVVMMQICLLQDRDTVWRQRGEDRPRTLYLPPIVPQMALSPDIQSPHHFTPETRVRQWTDGGYSTIADVDRVIAVANVQETHWVCIVFDMRQRRMEYYDSIAGGPYQPVVTAMRRWVADEWRLRGCGDSPGADDFAFVHCDAPRQDNDVDCGVFALLCAELAGAGEAVTFNPADVPTYHRKILALRCYTVSMDVSGVQPAAVVDLVSDDDDDETAGNARPAGDAAAGDELAAAIAREKTLQRLSREHARDLLTFTGQQVSCANAARVEAQTELAEARAAAAAAAARIAELEQANAVLHSTLEGAAADRATWLFESAAVYAQPAAVARQRFEREAIDMLDAIRMRSSDVVAWVAEGVRGAVVRGADIDPRWVREHEEGQQTGARTELVMRAEGHPDAAAPGRAPCFGGNAGLCGIAHGAAEYIRVKRPIEGETGGDASR